MWHPRGSWSTCPQDFAIDKEVPFLFVENAPLFKETMPSKRHALKFEILPSSLVVGEHAMISYCEKANLALAENECIDTLQKSQVKSNFPTLYFSSM